MTVMGTMVSEATAIIETTDARPAACSKHVVSQSRCSTTYNLQTVGPWSTFYTHTATYINVTLCNLTAQAYTLDVPSLSMGGGGS